VIGCAEYGSVKLVKIRNPWGSEGYTGDWSDKSSKWDSSSRAALNHVEKDDGIFWMTLSDFKDLFNRLTVGYNREY